jgi:hypothetical protein
MANNTNAEAKLRAFITKLASLEEYRVTEVSRKPQIYSINTELVNIRSRGKPRETADGNRSFWYDVAFSVLPKVKWVIYIATDSDYFVMLPGSFLDSLKDHMYPNMRNAGTGVFYIDWDSLAIELSQGERISISEYYHNLIEPECYPEF